MSVGGLLYWFQATRLVCFHYFVLYLYFSLVVITFIGTSVAQCTTLVSTTEGIAVKFGSDIHTHLRRNFNIIDDRLTVHPGLTQMATV